MLAPLLVTIAALIAPAPAPDAGQEIVQKSVTQEETALTAFDHAVRDYMALHHRLARRAPRLQVTSDPAELLDAINQLGEAIRMERYGARTGEVFTPVVAPLFRHRIHRALRDVDVAELMTEMEEDNDPLAPTLVVNGRFPWGAGNAMWPSVLAVLPDLPAQLEYRFVGADLVLIDIRANLVVDILEGALTSGS